MEIEMKFDEYSLHFLKTAERTKQNIFLTAKAWAWKSTLINFFVNNTKKKVALLGTTWISALNIGGKTIHSYFSIMPGKKVKKALKKEQIELIKMIDVFIIDEVSMMRADLFDILNYKMQSICENKELFWWKQFIFVWDLFQLPPVPETDEEDRKIYDENYEWLFFFEAKTFDREKFEIIELQKVYRQDNPVLVKALNTIREWVKSQAVVDYFNKRVVSQENLDTHAIMLTSTNRDAEQYNFIKLWELPWEIIQSIWILKGEYDEDLPVDKFLKFKVWARIMFVVNENVEQTYMNGTLWTIKGIQDNAIIVDIDDFWEVTVSKYVWNNIDGENEFWEPNIIGQYIQYPFKLAFAISIHKSQWKSFEKVIVNMGWGAFAEGMTYVALSRCRTYEGLQLVKPIKLKDIQVSQKVLNFLKK